jgi:hypothetical protein
MESTGKVVVMVVARIERKPERFCVLDESQDSESAMWSKSKRASELWDIARISEPNWHTCSVFP